MNDTISSEPAIAATFGSERIDWIKETLLPFFTRLSSLAEGAREKLLTMLLLSSVSACWLTYFAHWLFDFGAPALAPIFFAFVIPSLFIWKLRATLNPVIAVPGQLLAMGDSLKQLLAHSRNDMREQLSELREQRPSPNKLKELIRTIRQLVGQGKLLKDLSVEFAKTGKQDVIEAVILVASPQFAILMGIATIGTVTSVIFSAVSGIVYLVKM